MKTTSTATEFQVQIFITDLNTIKTGLISSIKELCSIKHYSELKGT